MVKMSFGFEKERYQPAREMAIVKRICTRAGIRWNNWIRIHPPKYSNNIRTGYLVFSKQYFTKQPLSSLVQQVGSLELNDVTLTQNNVKVFCSALQQSASLSSCLAFLPLV